MFCAQSFNALCLFYPFVLRFTAMNLKRRMRYQTWNDVNILLKQRFSTFLTPPLFNTVPQVVVASNHEIILSLLYSCNFGTVMNCYVNI